MISAITALLVMINPFAIFIYLTPVMRSLHHRGFVLVFLKSSLISFFLLLFFFFAGEYVFKNILSINFESFRIFGGIVIFSFAYLYIVSGRRALILIKENLDDLASEIAIPFIAGVGTISLTILVSHRLNMWQGILTITSVLLINFGIIIGLKLIRDRMPSKKFKIFFDKNMQVLMRIMGFLIGAIGIDLIIAGIKNSFGL